MTAEDVSLFSKNILSLNLKNSTKEFKNIKKLRELFRNFFLAHINDLPISNIKKQLSDFFFEYQFILGFETNSLKPRWVLKNKNRGLIELLILDFFVFLGSVDMKRVKKCVNPNCSIIFCDSSKNNTRSWCSMQSCGNLAKARAFYKRSKKSI